MAGLPTGTPGHPGDTTLKLDDPVLKQLHAGLHHRRVVELLLTGRYLKHYLVDALVYRSTPSPERESLFVST